MTFSQPQLLGAAAIGLVVGLVLLSRGLSAYRHAAHVGGVATSRLDALAAGEVRVTGIVEPLALTLVSPLQSASCVWYRSSLTRSGDTDGAVMREERAVEFRLRDERGSVRVVPRGARWEVDAVFDESTDMSGDAPPGLLRNHGPTSRTPETFDRDRAIAELSTVRPPTDLDGDEFRGFDLVVGASGSGPGGRRYREARVEPGQQVTVLGLAVPFGDLDASDPNGIYEAPIEDAALIDDMADARAAGQLASTPEEAWGNAAIPGFGIGEPVSIPELDPQATPLPLAAPAVAERVAEVFDPPAETLVVTAGPGSPLVVYAGTPQAAARSHDGEFALGLAGAALSILSAAGLAVILNGGL